MRLKNFRQFKGEQKVKFSTDNIKNVTVISGENDSGKTTLAQAFTWCLYGDTDFEDKVILNKIKIHRLLPGEEEDVCVELDLIHNDIEYTIIRKQKYSKDSNGNLKRPGQTIFKIAYKKDGQREFVKDLETEIRMKEILPNELSRYFFFDGERIGNMSKEIRRGKSKEFAEAVRGLLGLSAFTAALDHLKGKTTRLSVIRSYNESYDSASDIKIEKYTNEINEYEAGIDKIDSRLEEIDNYELLAQDKCTELNERIKKNSESESLAVEKERLRNKLSGLISQKEKNISDVLKIFNKNAPSYFSKKLMKDALMKLAEAEKIDKGIPDIHARTIDFLIKRGACLCDTPIKFGDQTHKSLMKVLEFIPPQSIGSAISQFIRECELKSRIGDDLFEDLSQKYAIVREFDNSFAEIESDIKVIEERLEGMENVGELQKDLTKYERELRSLKGERDELNLKKGSLETSKKIRIAERNELALKDDNNRKIEIYKAYAEYMYNLLNAEYKAKEEETRILLQKTINEIFQSIFEGDFSLEMDEKYNIQIITQNLDGHSESVETGTARSTSVIFAFIAGIIKMARESKSSENEMLLAEPYPLVMDAPLSAFDKNRIKTVCETLPNIAEQVIIFIKDTDGEIAEKYMGNKVGLSYIFNKINKFETYIEPR